MIQESLLQINQEELQSVDSFRKGRNTAVLTIMFTDIQGYTLMTEEKGEHYSAKVRDHHDPILKREIEKDGRGLIVKFIGDAVMAVFSEPSKAVQCALDIQNSLHAFNNSQSDLEDINVRIGLHMGQVSVENNLQIDVFGRHVNRAARIESLAEGGQILLSYPVFDSAKGWLGSHTDIEWVKHGDYQFKGIEDTTTIYEVVNPLLGRSAQAPAGAIQTQTSRTGSFCIGKVAAGLVLAGVLGWAGLYFTTQTEVSLQKYHADHSFIDGERLVLNGNKGDDLRLVQNTLKPGKHILHYDVNYITRYYAPIEIKRGENFIQPQFEESRLPNISLRIEMPKNQANWSDKKTQSFTYFEYKNGERIDHTTNIVISIDGQRDDTEQTVIQNIHWVITLDGKEITNKSIKVEAPYGTQDLTRAQPEEADYADDFHKFRHHYYGNYMFIDFTVTGDLAEYSYLRED